MARSIIFTTCGIKPVINSNPDNSLKSTTTCFKDELAQSPPPDAVQSLLQRLLATQNYAVLATDNHGQSPLAFVSDLRDIPLAKVLCSVVLKAYRFP